MIKSVIAENPFLGGMILIIDKKTWLTTGYTGQSRVAIVEKLVLTFFPNIEQEGYTHNGLC